MTEEAGAPQQPSRRVQWAYTKSHHTPTNGAQLRRDFPGDSFDSPGESEAGLRRYGPQTGHQTSISVADRNFGREQNGGNRNRGDGGHRNQNSGERLFLWSTVFVSGNGCLLRLKLKEGRHAILILAPPVWNDVNVLGWRNFDPLFCKIQNFKNTFAI